MPSEEDIAARDGGTDQGAPPDPSELPGLEGLPRRAALVYLAVGLVWIAGSDLLASDLVPVVDRDLVQSIKGVLFVLVTSIILHRVLSIQVGRYASSVRELQRLREAHRGEAGKALALLAATEGIHEAVVMTDASQRIIHVNAAFERSSGYTRDELLGKTPRVFRSGFHTADFYASMYARLGAGETWTGTFRNRRKDGSVWHELATIAPVLRDGVLTHYVKVARDVTDQTELDRRMRNQQKLEAVGTLAGGIAHEFNNLLGMILGYSELVADALPEASRARSDLERIVAAADRGSDLVRQLLAFSRGNEGARQRMRLQPLVEETAKFLRSSLPAGIELALDLGAPGFEVDGDPAQIRQALVNLVTNSGQALPSGKGRIGISLVASPRDPDEVVLAVEDDGVGIPPGNLARVLEPFFTTRAPGEGSGLGLSVVHGVVTAMGGSLEIESHLDQGTKVRLRMPRAVDPGSTAPPRGEVAVAVVKGRKVLVVEDEAMLLETTQRTLETLGLQVETFRDPLEAVRRIEGPDADFDLLITDLSMPGLSGIEVARGFKTRWPGRPTLMVTGFGDRELAERAAGEVIDRVLRKPVRRTQLAQALGEILR